MRSTKTMKLSELIARLAEMLEEHGDIAVKTDDDGRYRDASSVYFSTDEAAVIVE